MDIELLPCPFCGSDDISSGEAMIEHPHEPNVIYKQTGCLSCGAFGSEAKEDSTYGNKCDAAWNTRQQLAKPAVEWISVKDRLPIAMENVLCVSDGKVYEGYKRLDDEDSQQWYLVGLTDRDGDYIDVYDVTHWQPLPNPPAAYDASR